MMSVAITLHLLGTIVWVGGMFFAHMALRPVPGWRSSAVSLVLT